MINITKKNVYLDTLVYSVVETENVTNISSKKNTFVEATHNHILTKNS